MKLVIAASLLTLLAAPAVAQTVSDDGKAPRAPLELDLDRPADTANSDPDADTVDAMLADDHEATDAEKAASDALASQFSIDTPIMLLIDDPRAKAVLDEDMPGLSSDENYAKFKTMSLRQLQPQTGGQLTKELLMKVQKDLEAIGGEADDAAEVDRGEGR